METENTDGLKAHMFWMEELYKELATLPKKITQIINNDIFKGFRKNNEAMLRACEKNNYDMIQTFLRYDFDIEHDLYQQADLPHPNFPISIMGKPRNNDQEILEQLRYFQASTKTFYMIAKFQFERNKGHEEEIDDYDMKPGDLKTRFV